MSCRCYNRHHRETLKSVARAYQAKSKPWLLKKHFKTHSLDIEKQQTRKKVKLLVIHFCVSV